MDSSCSLAIKSSLLISNERPQHDFGYEHDQRRLLCWSRRRRVAAGMPGSLQSAVGLTIMTVSSCGRLQEQEWQEVEQLCSELASWEKEHSWQRWRHYGATKRHCLARRRRVVAWKPSWLRNTASCKKQRSRCVAEWRCTVHWRPS